MSDQNFAKIIGPINQSENFYMGLPNDPYNSILTYRVNKVSGEIDYLFYSSSSYPIAILRAEYYIDAKSDSNPNYIKLFDTINSVYIQGIQGLGFVYKPTSPVTPNPIYTNPVINWSYPTLFLANIRYSFQSCSTKTITDCNPGNELPGIIIPQNIYYNIKGICKTPTETSIDIWQKKIAPPVGATQKFYWTNLNDCNINVPYEYCTNDQVCGDKNCKGICPPKTDDKKTCQYDKDTSLFKCTPPKNNGSAGTLSTGIIIILIVGVILFIISISLIVYFNMRKKKKEKDDSNIDLLTSLSNPLELSDPLQQLEQLELSDPLQQLELSDPLQQLEPLQQLQPLQPLQQLQTFVPLQQLPIRY